MRIAIDATSSLLRSAGVKSYTYYWLRALLECAAPGQEIRAFPFLRHWERLDHEHSLLPPFGTWTRLALVHAINTLGSGLLDTALQGCDVFHAGNLVRRAPSKARLTATVHDLTAWVTPQHHTRAIAQGDLLFAERVLQRAHGLIAVSENTRQDAIRILGIAPERIRTIYSGVASEYFDAPPAHRARPYALYVGTIEPRKNLDTLLDAWKALPPDLREAFDLVIAGPVGWHSEPTLARIRSGATYLGYVPEADMPGLFAGASLFVYPSLYEGFGFPVVQAMAANVPVITSKTSCLPEVTGGSAALINPHSPVELTRMLADLLTSESRRRELAQQGRIRAERFRWKRCAEESLDFFRNL